MTIQEYVMEHTERGECKCGRCIDVGNKADPNGHTADMIFFKVALRPDKDGHDANAEEFMRLAKAHVGDFCAVNLEDEHEHSYLELGGWIGDQGIALQFMALGSLLGVFDLLTPRTMLPGIDLQVVMTIAGAGLVTIKRKALVVKAS